MFRSSVLISLLCFLFQLGACPCGCWEENHWWIAYRALTSAEQHTHHESLPTTQWQQDGDHEEVPESVTTKAESQPTLAALLLQPAPLEVTITPGRSFSSAELWDASPPNRRPERAQLQSFLI